MSIDALSTKTKDLFPTSERVAKTRAQIQKEYRERKAKEGKRQRTFIIDQDNLDSLTTFLMSKQEGAGQFSKHQNEATSQVINRALRQFFRKR